MYFIDKTMMLARTLMTKTVTVLRTSVSQLEQAESGFGIDYRHPGHAETVSKACLLRR